MAADQVRTDELLIELGGPEGAAPTPLGGSYGFFADPDGHLWEVIHHPLYQLGTDGRPRIP